MVSIKCCLVGLETLDEGESDLTVANMLAYSVSAKFTVVKSFYSRGPKLQ